MAWLSVSTSAARKSGPPLDEQFSRTTAQGRSLTHPAFGAGRQARCRAPPRVVVLWPAGRRSERHRARKQYEPPVSSSPATAGRYLPDAGSVTPDPWRNDYPKSVANKTGNQWIPQTVRSIVFRSAMGVCDRGSNIIHVSQSDAVEMFRLTLSPFLMLGGQA